MKELLFHGITKCGVVSLLVAAAVTVTRPDMPIPGTDPGMGMSVCAYESLLRRIKSWQTFMLSFTFLHKRYVTLCARK